MRTVHLKPRAMSQGELAALGARSPEFATKQAQKAAQKQVQGQPMSGAVKAPGYEVSAVFSLQSYFDDTLMERALFRQAPNQSIVASTLPDEPIQVAGYGLALHPSSETPVAVQFETGAQQGRSQTYHLKPGQLIRPQGEKPGQPGFFTGFTWGLPFGWLGGGSATLVVLRSPDAHVEWATDHNEVVFHRIRLPIWDPADPEFPVAGGAYNGPINWPTRFPWPFAQFGANSLTQRGQPSLAVVPTTTEMSLRLATVTVAAAPADGTMRMYFVGADIWASSGPNAASKATISLADVRAVDEIWGTWAQQAGAPAPFNSAFPTQSLTGAPAKYAANAGAVLLSSLDPQLQDAFVDITRFGRL